MINTDMRLLNYFTFGEKDEYGQEALSSKPVGKVKMAIYITSQSIQDNINYKDSQYIGLTRAKVDDTYVIDYNGALLKVLYVNNQGRYNQVFLQEM